MYATNVCRRDGDVLLRADTLEDEFTRKETGVKNKGTILFTNHFDLG